MCKHSRARRRHSSATLRDTPRPLVGTLSNERDGRGAVPLLSRNLCWESFKAARWSAAREEEPRRGLRSAGRGGHAEVWPHTPYAVGGQWKEANASDKKRARRQEARTLSNDPAGPPAAAGTSPKGGSHPRPSAALLQSQRCLLRPVYPLPDSGRLKFCARFRRPLASALTASEAPQVVPRAVRLRGAEFQGPAIPSSPPAAFALHAASSTQASVAMQPRIAPWRHRASPPSRSS